MALQRGPQEYYLIEGNRITKYVEGYDVSYKPVSEEKLPDGLYETDDGKFLYRARNHSATFEKKDIIKIDNFEFIEFDDLYSKRFVMIRYAKNEKEVVMPETCNGKMYDIGAGAFNSCTKLEKIKLGKVWDISKTAFSNCPRLFSVWFHPSQGKDVVDKSRWSDTVIEFVNCKKVEKSEDKNFKNLPAYAYKTPPMHETFITQGDFTFYYGQKDKKYYLINYAGKSDEIVLPDYVNGNGYIVNYKAIDLRTKDGKEANVKRVVLGKGVIGINIFGILRCSSFVLPQGIKFVPAVTLQGTVCYEGGRLSWMRVKKQKDWKSRVRKMVYNYKGDDISK